MTLLDVEIEYLDEAGNVTKTITRTVRQVRDNLVFLYDKHEGPYCIGGDECDGFWCCDPTSRERLSKKSADACRALQKGSS